MAAWSAAALLVALGTTNPYFRLTVIAAGVGLLARGPRSRRGLARLGSTLAGAIVLSTAFNALLSHVGSDAIFTIPAGVPLLGGRVTVESVAYGMNVGLGLAGAVIAVAPLSLLLESHEVLNALPASLQRMGGVISASLNLLPGIGRSYSAIRDGQSMRGWRLRGPRSWSEVVVPTLLTALEDSVQLAETMEARGYSAARRTSYLTNRWSRGDSFLVAAAAAVVALFMAGQLSGAIVDWHAYPDLAAPSFSLLAPAILVLLLAPGPRWR